MLHDMKLRRDPFERIADGRKTVELRLYDEKRQLIRVGDRIRFTQVEDPHQTLTVRVVALHRFPRFLELYESLPLEKCGYAAGENGSYRDMEQYYSPDEQARFGVVGIEIERV